MEQDVQKISPAAALWIKDSLLPRALLKGTRGMRAAGKAFLFPHTLESDINYTRRLDSSTLLNAFRKTSTFLAGQVFQSDIILSDGTSAFNEWVKEIDTAGNTLDVFAKRVFVSGIGEGVRHILIDMPQKDDSVQTVADEKAQGVRPYMREIKGKDILGGLVDESGFLIQVRIKETTERITGKYSSKTVNRIRVIGIDYWEIHEEDDKGTYVLSEEGSFDIGIIPFVSFIPGEESTMLTGETPIMDLADLNAKHWRSSSDQDNYLSYCRFPLYFGKNLGDINILPMGRQLINSDDDNAELHTVEMTGSSISAGQSDLTETEAKMALYGLQQLVPRAGNMTATEKALTSAESNSSLGTWATEFESVLNKAMYIMGMLMQQTWPDNGLSVNKEYNFGVADPQELAQILSAHEQGVISAQGCFTEFRRRGVFDEHMTWEDMENDIEKEQQNDISMSDMAGSSFGDE